MSENLRRCPLRTASGARRARVRSLGTAVAYDTSALSSHVTHICTGRARGATAMIDLLNWLGGCLTAMLTYPLPPAVVRRSRSTCIDAMSSEMFERIIASYKTARSHVEKMALGTHWRCVQIDTNSGKPAANFSSRRRWISKSLQTLDRHPKPSSNRKNNSESQRKRRLSRVHM